jgi:hypothetical protein
MDRVESRSSCQDAGCHGIATKEDEQKPRRSRIAVSNWPLDAGTLLWSAEVRTFSVKTGWHHTVHGGNTVRDL